mgnify:CR=1 FL=1
MYIFAMNIIKLYKDIIFNANLLITNGSYNLTRFVGTINWSLPSFENNVKL